MGLKEEIRKDLFKSLDGITDEVFDSLSQEEQIEKVKFVKKKLSDLHYQKLLNNYILSSKDLWSLLETYIFFNETNKINYLSWMLNKYYSGFLKKKFEKSIIEEEYELSGILLKLIPINGMPINKQ